MGRPGFVLEVDDRTPPLLVPDGDRLHLEKFPLGTRVIYPAESLARVPDLGEAINTALDAPLDSEPLSALLKPEMRLTITFDDIGTPTPRMRRPDIRGKVIEAVLSQAAAQAKPRCPISETPFPLALSQELHWRGENVVVEHGVDLKNGYGRRDQVSNLGCGIAPRMPRS